MFIEMWTDLEFDPHGNNPYNDIVDEVQPLTDKTCPIIIPNGAPFKAGSVSIKTPDGQPLTTGWKEVFKPMPLIEITGLDIYTFIEIDATVLANNDSLTISYHSVGTSFIPRNSLEEALEAIEHGKLPIPWSKVIQIPDQLPSSYHWHSINELLDWTDLVLYTRYISTLWEQHQNKQQKITDVFSNVREVMDNLIARYNLVNNQLITHTQNYSNPHGTDAFDLFMGNVDNFYTATIDEDKAGERSDLFSTAYGAIEAVKLGSPDMSKIMKNGTLPISLMGSTDYLPPVIDGSFEGIGTDSNITAACLENSGRLMVIKRHFDGRVRGLYFSYFENYKQANLTAYFTGFKYENAALKQAGYSLDTVLRGSGDTVLMVGDSTAGKWWVSLTNGTLNPTTHSFTEVNMSGVPRIDFDQRATPLTIGATKNYLIIVSPTRDGNNSANNMSFWVIPVTSLNKGTVVTPTRLAINYTNFDGTTFSNATVFQPAAIQKDGNNNLAHYFVTFNPPAPIAVTPNYGDPVWLVEESDNVILMRCGIRPYLFNGNVSPVWQAYFNINYSCRIDISTGNITLLDRTPDYTIDTTDYDQVIQYYSGFINNSTGIDFACAPNLLSDGNYVTFTNRNSTTTLPFTYNALIMNQKSRLDTIKILLTDDTMPEYNGLRIQKSLNLTSPLKEGPNAGHPVWDEDGEFIPSYGQSDDSLVTTYRKVTGQYQNRPGVTNLKLSNLLSRPLVNTVYGSNLGFNYPMVLLTGTAAELAADKGGNGVEMGRCSMSQFQVIYYDNSFKPLLPVSTGIPQTVGDLFVVPRTISKTFNEDTLSMNVSPNTYYGITPSTLRAIANLFPTDANQSQYFSMRIVVPYQAAIEGSLAQGLPCFACIYWYSESNKKQVGGSFLALNLSYKERPDLTPPTTELVNPVLVATGATAMGDNLQWSLRQMYLPTQGASAHWPFYKNGTQFTVKAHTGIMITSPGGAVSPRFDFTFNTATNQFSDTNVLPSYQYGREGTPAVIPRYGYGTPYTREYTGGACFIANVNGNDFLLASLYPDTGWVIFFKAGTKLVIFGTQYDAPEGTVDLRDIDPSPANKTFYVYATCYGDEAFFIVSGEKIRHNLSIIPVAKVNTNDTQILTIERLNTFMIGDAFVSSTREAGTIPLSTGLPMDEGKFVYVYKSDL